MNRIDHITDGVTKLLEKRDVLERLYAIDDAIGIIRQCREDVMLFSDGWYILESAQIELEKQAARICSDALSGGAVNAAKETRTMILDKSLPDSNEGSVADGILPTESSEYVSGGVDSDTHPELRILTESDVHGSSRRSIRSGPHNEHKRESESTDRLSRCNSDPLTLTPSECEAPGFSDEKKGSLL